MAVGDGKWYFNTNELTFLLLNFVTFVVMNTTTGVDETIGVTGIVVKSTVATAAIDVINAAAEVIVVVIGTDTAIVVSTVLCTFS